MVVLIFFLSAHLSSDLGEVELPNEAEIILETKELLLKFLENAYPEGGKTSRRDFHTKAHGCVNARFEVEAELPNDLAKGVFQKPRSYDAVVRFSNGDSRVGPDIVSGSRGMAIKLYGVQGERLMDNDAVGDEQDFAMINRPSFFIKDARENLIAIRAREEDRIWQDYVFHGGVKFWNWHLAGAIQSNQNNQIDNPLNAIYFSMTPYKLGDQAIKFRAAPCESWPPVIPENPEDNYLRSALKSSLEAKEFCFLFEVQRRTHPEKMPIENARKVWSERLSQFIRVAKLTIPSQDFDTDEKMARCEALSFAPWNGISEHKPLGSLNRVRKVVYEASARYRDASIGQSK